ncbi:MAG TPA: RHS repeat-associated core domain-containing protein [Opitutaceae bacterium]|jgi:RHS repeat-associated protein|nr:RHS repeat-associated core domain-containing protein [Opitutaceae bacterium]
MKLFYHQTDRKLNFASGLLLTTLVLGLAAARLAADDPTDPASAFAQPLAGSPGSVEYPSNVGVYVWAEAKSINGGSIGFNAASEIYWHKEGTSTQNTSIAMNAQASAGGQWVSDGGTQWLPITTDQAISYHDISGSNASSFRFHVQAPSGYDVYFYDQTKGYFVEESVLESDISTSALLFIVRPKGETGVMAGQAGDITPGQTNLRIGLGFLPNGQSAGFLDFDPIEHFGASDALGSYFLLYSYQLNGLDRSQYRLDLPGRISAPFYCYPTSDQVKVVFEDFTSVVGQANRRIRQILTPQAFVNIIHGNDESQNTVQFFPASAATPDGNGGYQASGTPYVAYVITTGGENDANWQCYITRTEGSTTQEASMVNEPTYDNISVEVEESHLETDTVTVCGDDPSQPITEEEYCGVVCTPDETTTEECGEDCELVNHPITSKVCWTNPIYECVSGKQQQVGTEEVCDEETVDNYEEECTPTYCDVTIPGTCTDQYCDVIIGYVQRCIDYPYNHYVTDLVPESYSVLAPRSTLHVNGFNGSHDETGVSYNSMFPATGNFNGDFFQASQSDSSMKLVGRYGGGSYTHTDDPNNPYTTPDFTSTYETVFDLVNNAPNLDALHPDFANGTLGYTTHRKYYDVFNFDPNADRYPGRAFYEERPDRSWTQFGYYADQNRIGLTSEIVTPFGDTSRPAALPATTAGGYRVQTIDYAPDWDGAYRVPSRVENWVDGTQMAVSTYAYSAQPAANGQPVWQAVSSDSATDNPTQIITRTAKVYQGAGVDPWYRNQPYSIQAADGSKQCYAYERGTFSNGTFTTDPNGNAFRATVVNGTSVGAGLTTLSGCSQTIDAIALVANVSTRDVAIRDERGFLVRTEKWFYDGSGWNQLEWENISYDMAGHVIRRQASTGALYEAEYTDVNNGSVTYGAIVFTNSGNAIGRKQYEKDERGVITQYTYDSLGRVQQSLQLAIPASADNAGGLPSKRTRFTYDSDGRITEKQVGDDNAEQYVSTYGYDFSGRLITQTELGQTTSFSYALQNGQIQSVTQTLPDGTTVITATNRDGSPQSKTGSAVVSCYYSYSLDGNRLLETKFEGSNNSPRWTKTWTDGLGRVMQKQQATPASVGAPFAEVYTYNDKGQRAKVQTGGLAPVLYVYDLMGRLTEKGTDLDGDGQLGSADRIERWVSNHGQRDGAWWVYAESYVYPENSGDNGVLESKSWTRETGFDSVSVPSSSQIPVTGQAISEVITQDADGNESRNLVFVNRDEGNQTSVATSPLAAQPSVTRSVGGIPVEEVTPSGVLTKLDLDALQRVIRVYDRTRTSADGVNFVYDSGQTRVHETYDDLNHLSARYTYDAAGRVRKVEKPRIDYTAPGQPAAYDANVTTTTCYQYNQRGQLTHTWGDDVYPVKYEYDSYGDQITQRTYRSFGTWAPEQPALGSDPSFWPGGGDLTTFNNYPENGLLHTRTDAQGHAIQYTYNVRGDVTERDAARGTTADYSYDPATGELRGVSYSDGTPSLAYTYDRLGRLATVQDASGFRTFTFRSDLLPDQEKFGYNQGATAQSIYGSNLSVNYAYGPMNGALVAPLGFDLKDGGGATTAYSYRATLDAQTGRLASITSDAGTYNLHYVSNSDLLYSINNGAWSQMRSYEDHRDLLQTISTVQGAGTIGSYAYQNDPLGRRYQMTQTGQVFSPYVTAGNSVITQFTYNARSEVTDSDTRVGDPTSPASAPELHGRHFGYAYDDIGNRTQDTVNGVANTYSPNELNQYTSRQTPATLPVSGTAAPGSTVSINGSALAGSEWQNQYFYRDIAKNPTTGGMQSIAYSGVLAGQTFADTAFSWARPTAESFTYDNDGNLTSDGLWNYAYDAENRLSAAYSQYPDETGQRVAVQFTYDYQGRRVEKQVYNYNGSQLGLCRSRRLYVYDGWNLVAEYDASVVDGTRLGLVRTCTWGPDLSGTSDGAGGVGGLLALKDFRSGYAGVYQAAYDGNGNLTALTSEATGQIQAAYEYDAYGNAVRASGSYAKENPFRFSTKYQDVETGLLYYGNRYYSSSLGRFINQDPSEEGGGINLYGFTTNNPVNDWDYLGLDDGGDWGDDWGAWGAGISGSGSIGDFIGSFPRDGKLVYSTTTNSDGSGVFTLSFTSPEGDTFNYKSSWTSNGNKQAWIDINTDAFHALYETGATYHGSFVYEGDGKGMVWHEEADTTSRFISNDKSPPAVDAGQVWTDAGRTALQGANDYAVGLAEGTWGAIKGMGQMFRHPINTTQNLANGLGTFAANLVDDPSGTMSSVGNGLMNTLNDPHQIGVVVGNVAGGTFLGAGFSSAIGMVGRTSNLFRKVAGVAEDMSDASEKPVFRGGSSLEPRKGIDYKVGPDGNVTERGISLNADKLDKNIQKYGGAFEVDRASIPDGLKIKPTSGSHYEIVPVRPMPEAEYLNLMKQVKLKSFNGI